MESHSDILPLAFHVMWNAAQLERQRATRHGQEAEARQQAFAASRQRSKDDVYEQVMAEKHSRDVKVTLSDPCVSEKMTSALVVLDCEAGERVVKRVFQDARDTTGVSETEDRLVDWLYQEMTVQQSDKVDVTLYLSQPPQDTSSDAFSLWWAGLEAEGKHVTMRVHLASLGCLCPWSKQSGRHGNQFDAEETRNVTGGLQRLRNRGAEVKLIAPSEWPTLMSLLADRTALGNLNTTYQKATETLDGLLSK